MKSCSPQALSCIFTGEFFSFGLRDVVNLSTTFFIQRFLRFYFFIKTRFLTFFILEVNVLYIYGLHVVGTKDVEHNHKGSLSRVLPRKAMGEM